MSKKTIYSGMQPSGLPSLGNYLGALKNWVSLQDSYNCVYCIVDMHAITVRQNPEELKRKIRDLYTMVLACGVDTEKATLYCQSQVSSHAELSWILNCYTYMGELGRMTQFKEKSQKHNENINCGLFSYPVLMAADILLFDTDLVPVGEDQRQHLELCRDLAIRFNGIYGDVFKVPEGYIPETGARIMSLQDPTKKMSKSDDANDGSVIFLLDEPDTIRNKIKRSVTDSENCVRYSEEKPGISNLLEIYCAMTKKTIKDAEKEFEGVGYGKFKTAVAEALIDGIKPIQERFKEYSSDKAYIDKSIYDNKEKANELSKKVLNSVKEKVGFLI